MSGRRYAFSPIFLIALFFIMTAPVFWHMSQVRQATVVEAYDNLDLYQEVYPVNHYGFERLRMGEIPLWNPKQFCGVPFQADPRTALFQPLNAVFLLAPTERAMAAHSFLCLFLMGTCFALFLRAQGLRYAPALLGGAVYAFNGAAAAVMCRPAMADALVWTSVAFWAAREYSREFRYAWAVLLGLGGGLLLLSGAHALALAQLGIVAPYAVYRVILPERDRLTNRADLPGRVLLPIPNLPNRLAGLFIALAVMLGVSAIQWIPTLAWLFSTERPAAAFWNWRVSGLAPASGHEWLVQAIMTRPGLLPRMGYIGMTGLLFVPVAWFQWRRWRDLGYFTVALIVTMSLSLIGAASSEGAFPMRAFLFPCVLCMAVLCAFGADRLLSPRGPHSPRVYLPALLLIVLGGFMFYIVRDLSRGYLIVLVLILAPALVLRTRWSSAAAGTLLTLLLTLDLAVAGATAYYHPFINAPGCYQRYAPTLQQAEEQALGARVLVSTGPLNVGLSSQLGLVTPLHMAGGPGGTLPKDLARWWQVLTGSGESDSAPPDRMSSKAAHPKLLNLMAARVVLASREGGLFEGHWAGPGPHLRQSGVDGPVRLFVNDDALPRAYWVPRWQEASGIEAAIAALTGPDFDADRTCIVDGALAGPALPDSGSLSYRDAACTVTDPSGERVRVRVQAPQAGIVVLADTYAVGWKARLDGRPCPLLRVNGVFRGVHVPTGPHELVFEYDPLSFRIGQAMTLTVLVALACTALAAIGRRFQTGL